MPALADLTEDRLTTMLVEAGNPDDLRLVVADTAGELVARRILASRDRDGVPTGSLHGVLGIEMDPFLAEDWTLKRLEA